MAWKNLEMWDENIDKQSFLLVPEKALPADLIEQLDKNMAPQKIGVLGISLNQPDPRTLNIPQTEHEVVILVQRNDPAQPESNLQAAIETDKSYIQQWAAVQGDLPEEAQLHWAMLESIEEIDQNGQDDKFPESYFKGLPAFLKNGNELIAGVTYKTLDRNQPKI